MRAGEKNLHLQVVRASHIRPLVLSGWGDVAMLLWIGCVVGLLAGFAIWG